MPIVHRGHRVELTHACEGHMHRESLDCDLRRDSERKLPEGVYSGWDVFKVMNFHFYENYLLVTMNT